MTRSLDLVLREQGFRGPENVPAVVQLQHALLCGCLGDALSDTNAGVSSVVPPARFTRASANRASAFTDSTWDRRKALRWLTAPRLFQTSRLSMIARSSSGTNARKVQRRPRRNSLEGLRSFRICNGLGWCCERGLNSKMNAISY